MYDVAIVGGGPAGIAAGINLSVRKLSFALFSQETASRKLVSAREIPNYPGLPGISGESLSEKLQKHLAEMGASALIKTIDHIYDMGDYYALTSGDEMWEAKSIILTTGVSAQKPLAGEEALIGRGVSYCATCDGMLYKGGHVAVIAYEDSAAEEAEYLSKIASVTYIPAKNGVREPEDISVLRGAKPVGIQADGRGVLIQTDINEIKADCAFIFRSAIAPGTLLAGLQTDEGHVVVARDLSTNLRGVFAAGDVTGLPYQIAKAVGEGATAGLSAAKYISNQGLHANRNGG